MPLWQAHQIWWVSSRYCTVQSRCVQVAAMALYSFSGVRTSRPGRLPKRKILPELGFKSPMRAATTVSVPRSGVGGGAR